MKVYISKYALTKGILEGTVTAWSDDKKRADVRDCTNNKECYYSGSEFHKTKEAAIAKAEQKKEARIASLRKQLAKAEALEIKITEAKN